MLEEIRVWSMERMYNQRIMGEEWDLDIFPTIRKELKDNNITQSGYQQFEVRFGNDAFAVDLIRRIWKCRSIPCLHGLAAIAYLNHNAESYVAPGFSKQSFLSSYTYNVHPLNGSQMWPKTIYQEPLPLKKKDYQTDQKLNEQRISTGKRAHTISRVKGLQESSTCRGIGHKKSSCPGKAHVQDLVQAPVEAHIASRIGKMHVRKRKVSERIIEIGLSKKVVPK
uniref:Zinc finger PMZ-type domain-containing protein n=1 Tax=Lactuca sativa TaxID=4236 RepID=A0A9R1XER7_LACSA|nr:hypothetical protein LSAT_V11C500239320 [Lactuca sativa]